MGFFSWKTQDTDRSIANHYSSRVPFTVYMHDDKGNVYEEDNYEGYGDFGGKDYYELFAEMNGLEGRDQGISLAFSEDSLAELGVERPTFPNLVESKGWKWRDEEPKTCPDQGFFYPE